MKNIKFNKKILNITKKELKSKWWHRFAGVIIWTIILIFSFYLLLIMLEESEEIWWIITVILICASLIYLLLRLIYYIILYIVYGCEKERSKLENLTISAEESTEKKDIFDIQEFEIFYCDKCGNKLEDNSKFCSKCGAKI